MTVLRQRIITGLVLAGLFLAAVAFLPLQAIAIAFAVVATAGAWEWSQLAGFRRPVARLLYAAVLPAFMLLLWQGCELGGAAPLESIQPWLGVACLFWSIAMLLVESYPRGTWAWQSRIVRALMGWLILASTWLSVIYLLTFDHGALLLVLLVVGVAAADIGAYFSGRRWGRHKLAPSVSPGKTWEGLWGGLAAVMVITLIIWQSLPLAYTHLEVQSLLLMGLFLAGASILGDLTVSMVKRYSGVKDSGAMLPGHGGLLDRIDSICGAAPVFALGLILMGY